MPMGRRTTVMTFVLISLCLFAPAAWANVGSPYVLTNLCFLVLGNAAIALVEASLLGLLWKAPFGLSVGPMLGANYLTAFVGVLLREPLGGLWSRLTDPDPLGRVAWVTALGYLILVALSVAFEWPLCHVVLYRAAAGRRRRLRSADEPRPSARSSLLASLAATGTTSALLALLYLSYFDVTALTQVRRDDGLVPSTPDTATVYFVGPDAHFWRVRINGAGPTRLCGPVQYLWMAWTPGDYRARLSLEPNAEGDVSLHAPAAHSDALDECVIPAIARRMPDSLGGEQSPADVGKLRPRSAFSWVPPGETQWRLRFERYDCPRLVVETMQRPSEAYRVGLELPPYAFWPAYSPWLLPDERVVFQLGPNIVLLDPESRRIGIIARGTNPVVVPDSEGRTPRPEAPS